MCGPWRRSMLGLDHVQGAKVDARLIYNGIEAWFLIKTWIFIFSNN